MKVLISAGGTGGHINPAIAIGRCILENEPNAKILFIGSNGNLERKLYAESNFKFMLFEAKGLSRNKVLNNIGIIIKDYKAYIKIKKVIDEFEPDIGIGTGGYISAIAMTALKNKKTPFIIHEQNSYPGLATRFLSKYAKKYALAFIKANEHLKYKDRAVLTGNPIRKEFINNTKSLARQRLGFSQNEKIVLCFGGSLGARKLNEIFLGLVEKASKQNKFTIVVATGDMYYVDFVTELKQKKVNITKEIIIRNYIDNMSEMLLACDLAVTRSGAMTVSEIMAIKKPSILIPSPNVTADHQTKNAEELARVGGCEVISEKNLEINLIYDKINSIINDDTKITEMQKALVKISITDGDKRIYNIVKEVLKVT